MTTDAPSLSVVVVAYDMARELPRTLRSLTLPYQRTIDADDYEVVVVDNGSPTPVDVSDVSDVRADPQPIRLHRIDDAPPSPARAANLGIERSTGELIGLVIDGARMASPGLLAMALLASSVSPRAVITAPAWHLGASAHGHGAEDREAEDALLAEVGWEDDGYELFTISTPAGSSSRGLFGPMGESSSLFMRRELWHELDALDERFALPGGGLVNHDLYRRACGLPAVQLVVLLGEGTFHQQHGGAATSGKVRRDEMWADYESIRGEPHAPPANDPLYVGHVPPQYRSHLAWSYERSGCAGSP
jgi:hypothetical protein